MKAKHIAIAILFAAVLFMRAADLPQSIDGATRSKIEAAIDAAGNYDPAAVAITGGTISGATVTVSDPVASGQAASKNYVDSLARSRQPLYMRNSLSSDVSTYYKLTSSIQGSTVTNTFAGVTNNQYLISYVTDTSSPTFQSLLQGGYNYTFYAYKTGGGTVTIKPEIYVRNAGGSEYYEFPNADSTAALGTSVAQYSGIVNVSTNLSMAATDRLVVKIKVVSQTSTPAVSIITGPNQIAYVASPAQVASSSSITLTGYDTAVVPSSWYGWMPGYGSSVSNAAAPVYWSTTDSSGDVDCGFGFTSSDTTAIQTKYAFATIRVPPYASGWKVGDTLNVRYRNSSSGAATNQMVFRISGPGGGTFSTNLPVGAAAASTTCAIPVASLPTFAHPTAGSNWTVRVDFQEYLGATNVIDSITVPYQ